jgi:hypothetical protein
VLAITVCWLVAVACASARCSSAARPSRSRRARLRARARLTIVTCTVGGLFEAYLHWRAGLGWHGLHCLVGPVHRDLIPFETALSFVAAAVIARARHVARGCAARSRGSPRSCPLPFVERRPSARPTALRSRRAVGVPSARGAAVAGLT